MLNEEFAGKIADCVKDVAFGEDMKRHTTFKIGGAADCLAKPSSARELVSLISLCREYGAPYMVIGNGSNLLVSDDGVRGVVVKTENMSDCQAQDETIFAECGVLLSKLASFAMTRSLSGLEFAGGIPGTLGGGIYMNAGAYGGEISDVIESVTYMDEDCNIKTASRGELQMGYRKSMFTDKNYIVLSCSMKLKRADPEKIRETMRDFSRRRMERQPLTQPSAGSAFKRPEGNFAAKLIEDAGLKGFSIGGAQVSTKHGGFVINTGRATARDVMDVIDYVQKKVNDDFGVKLELEFKVVGENINRKDMVETKEKEPWESAL